MTTASPPDAANEAVAGLSHLDSELDASLIVAVHASSRTTLTRIRRIDLTSPVERAMRALDLAHRFALVPTRIDSADARPFRIGAIWRLDDADRGRRGAASEFDRFAHPGHVKVSWEIDVAPDDEEAEMSIRTRVTATDEATRDRLLDAWAILGPLNDALSAHAAHAVKDYAEDLDDGEEAE